MLHDEADEEPEEGAGPAHQVCDGLPNWKSIGRITEYDLLIQIESDILLEDKCKGERVNAQIEEARSSMLLNLLCY